MVGFANKRNLLELEGLVLPGAKAAPVKDIGDLAIAVIIEQSVDFGDNLGLEFADLRYGQRPLHGQGAVGSA